MERVRLNDGKTSVHVENSTSHKVWNKCDQLVWDEVFNSLFPLKECIQGEIHDRTTNPRTRS